HLQKMDRYSMIRYSVIRNAYQATPNPPACVAPATNAPGIRGATIASSFDKAYFWGAWIPSTPGCLNNRSCPQTGCLIVSNSVYETSSSIKTKKTFITHSLSAEAYSPLTPPASQRLPTTSGIAFTCGE